MSKARKRKGSLIVSEKGVDWTSGYPDTVAFDVLYKGDRVAAGPTGDQVVRDVIDQFEDYELIGAKISSKESEKIATDEGAALVVNAKKIITIHKSRREVVNEDRPNAITFCTVLPLSKYYETIAYITRNIKLNMCRCHVFAILKGQAEDAKNAIMKAQVEFVEKSQQAMVNPFAAAKNAPREVPTGQLFGKQIHRGDIKAIEIIGSGQFGAVYLATQSMRKCPIDGKLFAIDGHLKRYMDILESKGQTAPPDAEIVKVPVLRAVKMLKGSATPDAKEEFLREAETMLCFDHPNVTVIEGVAVQQPPWLYVLQYCMYGDLRQVLKTCQQRRFFLRPKELLILTTGILAGMEHIISKGMIHLDLAARNCLLAADNVVKVADFGLTRALPKGGNYLVIRDKGIKLAIKWLAPESLRARKFSEQSDIWAYGVTVWELYSYGRLPYPDMKNDETQKYILSGKHLDTPRGMPETVASMLKHMFAFEDNKRGTFADHLLFCNGLLARDQSSVRDVGKMLNDPELEKSAKEAERQANLLRQQQAVQARKMRADLIFLASKEQPIWWQEGLSKRDAEAAVLSNPESCFLFRRDNPERLVMVVNEYGQPSHYPVKVEVAVVADKKTQQFMFGGKGHSNLAEIIGNLRYAPFKGRLGKPIKLGPACVVKVATKALQPFQAQSKGNPLFNDDGGDETPVDL
eukprot:m.129939 g.129939  ORF g.129939 m.129939 type:complete len:690 (-) comp29446_c0_seq4:473-2542(-)